MLLKFTTADMLNTALIDVSTGERSYDISTTLQSPEDHPVPCSSSPSSSALSSLPQQQPSTHNVERRKTIITDASGKTVVDITWTGRHPNIIMNDDKIGGLTDLFGSTTTRFMPKILAIPTRFDTEYIWTATADSLTLFDYDANQIKGTFHQNTIRIPHRTKSTSFSPTSSASSSSSSTSSSLSSSPSSTFVNTHLPGLGSNYLEFCLHPLADPIEIILSFLIMEILRRGRFCLTPYTFERPKLWQLREARDLVLRRLRRNTV